MRVLQRVAGRRLALDCSVLHLRLSLRLSVRLSLRLSLRPSLRLR